MLKRSSSRRKRRRSAAFGTCLLLLLFAIILLNHHAGFLSNSGFIPSDHVSRDVQLLQSVNPLLKDQANLWRSLYESILSNDPQCVNRPDPVIPRQMNIGFDPDHEHARPDVLWMDDSDVQRLRTTHARFVDDLRRTSPRLVYQPGTRGIVTTASDGLLPTLIISLHMLRQTNSSLPVEVFLFKPSPYSDRFCESTLPQLGAECLYFSDVFTEASTGVVVETYQFKILTLLFSSFEDVLLLDSDSWPISQPDPIFDSPPFIETGLILWPDFWYPSESPYFFEVARITDIPPLNLRAATESGEIVYSKSRHEFSIMLAVYYNYYGPDYYYMLQSQGAPGMGDKETFPWAAKALNEEFYKVTTSVRALGRYDSDGEYLGSAMIQYDPVMDWYKHTKRGASIRSQQARIDGSNNLISQPSHLEIPGSSSKYDPRPLFIHANVPKFDPFTIFDDQTDGAKSPTRDSNGTSVRCWGRDKEDAIEIFGFDLEERFWQAIAKVTCVDLVAAENDDRITDGRVCERVQRYMADVFR